MKDNYRFFNRRRHSMENNIHKGAAFFIIEDKCKGCGKCLRRCPADAITGEKGKTFSIDQHKCIKCGNCYYTCRTCAIIKIEADL